MNGACIDKELLCFSTQEHCETVLLSDMAEQHDAPKIHESNDDDLEYVTPVDIKAALTSTTWHRALASQLKNQRLVELFDLVAKKY